MNFHEYIDRTNTNSSKWDDFAGRFPSLNTVGAIPMWVADMDFKAPQPVIEALAKRVEEGIYGYNVQQTKGFNEITKEWIERRYHWSINTDWVVFTPGVVPALCHAILAYTQPGDGVIIQPPVYYPFRAGIVNNGRTPMENSLILEDGSYRMDFEDLEKLASDQKTKLMILCSPHNPVGRVWGKEDLARVSEICLRNHVLLISDEIHADLLMKGNPFTAAAAAVEGEAYQNNLITCYAPSKTFNLAGIQASAIIIPEESLRTQFRRQIACTRLPAMNVFASLAVEAAWTHGDGYIEGLLEYIEANMDYMISYAKENLPRIGIKKPEGTYMVWMDLRGLGLSTQDCERFFVEKAKIAGDLGSWFGVEGNGFIRLNLACHRETLEKALKQLRQAYEEEGF